MSGVTKTFGTGWPAAGAGAQYGRRIPQSQAQPDGTPVMLPPCTNPQEHIRCAMQATCPRVAGPQAGGAAGWARAGPASSSAISRRIAAIPQHGPPA